MGIQTVDTLTLRGYLREIDAEAQVDLPPRVASPSPSPEVVIVSAPVVVVQREYVVLRRPFDLYDYTWSWGRPRRDVHHHHHHHAPRKSEKDRDRDQAAAAACIGTVAAPIVAGLVGYTYGLYSHYTKRLENTDRMLEAASTMPELNQNEPLRTRVVKVLKNQREIDQLQAKKVTYYFLAAIVALIGVCLLVGGGYAVIPALIAAGAITLVAAGVFASLNFGLHWNDSYKIAAAHRRIASEENPSILIEELGKIRRAPPPYTPNIGTGYVPDPAE